MSFASLVDKSCAIVRRDLLTSVRYRAGFSIGVLSAIAEMAAFYYLAHAVGPGFRPDGVDYYPFLLVGTGFYTFLIMGINSFMLGAQSVNPNFKIKIVWVNSWYDPGKEADAAKVLFGQGADIIVQHTDSTAPLQVAQDQGKLGFGQSSDMIKFAPKAQLTANTDNWNPYYISRVKAELDGVWKSDDTWGGMKEGMVVLSPFTNVPDDVKKMAEDSVAKIKSGELHPFTGPITKQDGSTVGEAGKSLPDEELLGMAYYVKGIDDKLPQ